MKKFNILLISFVVLFLITVYFSISITNNLNDYRDKKDEIAKEMNFEKRMLDASSYVNSLFGIGEDPEEKYNQLNIQADELYNKATKKGWYLTFFVLLFVVLNILYYRKKDQKLQVYGLIMVGSAIVYLFLGLQSPFLEIFAYNYDLEVTGMGMTYTYDGRTYYMYQNKSIIQLISLLYSGGNFLVAIALVVFSIIFPIFKVFSSIVVLLIPKSKHAKKAVGIINKIGKWSMADVFVAAIFLAYFSFSNMNVGVDTGAVTLIGTYFFMSFVVLSIASGVFLKKVIKKDDELSKI